VVVVVEGLNPSVPSFYGKTTGNTLGGEQLIPIFFTIGQAILQIERRVGKYFSTVSTTETFRMEVCTHGLQTIPDNLSSALAAVWSQILAIAVLTVQFAWKQA